MKSEWETFTLDDVCLKITDGAHNSPKSVDIGKPMASVKDLTTFGVDLTNARLIDEKEYEKLAKQGCQPHVNDVLIAKDGNSALDTVCVVKEPLDAVMLSSVAILRPDDNKLDSYYLKYYFSSKTTISYLKRNFISGAAIPRVVLRDFKKAEISLPPLNKQKVISQILRSLDDKIELNRKMNETLEAMAQALFKSWFVDFDPVHARAKCAVRNEEVPLGCTNEAELEAAAKVLGISKEVLDLFPSEFVESEMGMIPLGWEVSTITDEVTIYGGATPSTKEDAYWINGDNHWATPRDLSGLSSKVLIDTGRKITDAGVNKISSKQLPIGTVLLSSRAPVGYIAYSTVPISINQGFIAMVCNKRLSNYYIMYWLDIAMNEIKNRAIGTTFSEISKSAFRPIKLVIAETTILTSFNSIVSPMVNKIIANEYEVATLTKTRDALLPKLLSGELDVTEVKR